MKKHTKQFLLGFAAAAFAMFMAIGLYLGAGKSPAPAARGFDEAEYFRNLKEMCDRPEWANECHCVTGPDGCRQ
jgi:hypothetical protein